MPLVGRRNYLRAVDIYAALQELISSDRVEVRFLRPACHALRASCNRNEGGQLIARAYCTEARTRLFLTAVTGLPAGRVAEPDLAQHRFSADTGHNRINFDFEQIPSDADLLSVIFFRYQDVFGTRCVVSGLKAHPCSDRSSHKFSLQVSSKPERSGIFVATLADDLQARFTIEFKPRATGI